VILVVICFILHEKDQAEIEQSWKTRFSHEDRTTTDRLLVGRTKPLQHRLFHSFF